MNRIDLTFTVYIDDEMLATVRELQDDGEFGTSEATTLIRVAHESALTKIDDENR